MTKRQSLQAHRKSQKGDMVGVNGVRPRKKSSIDRIVKSVMMHLKRHNFHQDSYNVHVKGIYIPQCFLYKKK